MSDPEQACSKAPGRAETYQNRLSGPLLDRFDMHVDVPAVRPADLDLPAPAETSVVAAARRRQRARLIGLSEHVQARTNAEALAYRRTAPIGHAHLADAPD